MGTDPEQSSHENWPDPCSGVMPCAMALELRVSGPDCTIQRFPLPRGSFVIGRASKADVRLDHEAVSPRHAEIQVRGDNAYIADLRSRTGTWAGGKPVDLERVLPLGELVEIGPYVLRIGKAARDSGDQPVCATSFAGFDATGLVARFGNDCTLSQSGEKLVSIQVLALRSSASLAIDLAPVLAREGRTRDLVGATEEGEIILITGEGRRADWERRAIRLLRIAEHVAPEASLGFLCASVDPERMHDAIDSARKLAIAAVPGEIAGDGPDGKNGRFLTADGRALVIGDPGMQAGFRLLFHLAKSNRPVLLVGETGTGKEEAARKLHQWSGRPGPLVAVSCAEIDAPFLSAELFGHARNRGPGLAHRARCGTLFLDDIGELSVRAQGALLRFVETREVRPVGGGAPRRIDVGVVAATTVPVAQLRPELRHRFTVLSLPPLRERLDDIAPMARVFLRDACNRHGRRPLSLSPSAAARLREYSWPGNVRELMVLMEAMAGRLETEVLQAEHLRGLADWAAVEPEKTPAHEVRRATLPSVQRARLQGTLHEIERDETKRALAATNGNLTRAAAILGVTRNTLKRYLAAYGLRKPGTEREDPTP